MKTDLEVKVTPGASSAIEGGYREASSGTKRKYNGEKLYQEGIGKTTVKESHRVESRGR
jgi:hypothetical protein